MNIRSLIINSLDKKGEVRAADIIKTTGFSRTYVNRFFQQLTQEGKIILIGKANKARYIRATEKALDLAKKSILEANRILYNKNLEEDTVLDEIKKTTGILLEVPKNISNIFNYAFLEMLNNAIEHSSSEKIWIYIKRDKESLQFKILDKGVGIFNNIMRKAGLKSEMEAIQDLLKGKQSTAPETHSGEGIFFTSKAVDILNIRSSRKQLTFNNNIKDIFIKSTKEAAGTKILCTINFSSCKKLEKIFKQYTDDSYQFSKTKVTVKLYQMGAEHISRSQARRILSGLDKFKIIILDFKDVETVGQGFADEVFRVWKLRYPRIEVTYKNINENIEFMIKKALPRL
ncbi:MAG: DUF4325 domain-containing protein [Candidatus Omnitrophota bacterium]